MPSPPAEPRRVAFLVAELGRSGGMAVIRRHAAHLQTALGWDVALVVTDPKLDDALPDEDEGVPVRSLASAAEGYWDIALATWWTTTDQLWSVRADHRALFVQNIEHRFYRKDEVADRLAAMAVFDLPVDFIVIADYMVAMLAELRPDARVELVRNGVDKETYNPGPAGNSAAGEPLRILIEGQPTLWFKGVSEALQATAAMTREHTTTLVVHDPDDLERAEIPIAPDRVVGGLNAEEMAELYRSHDVLLKLSRFEGSPLPPLEAFHCGVPVVATPFSGHEEQIEDHVNGLIVGFDDESSTARALDRLAEDRMLLQRLSEGALESAHRWPGREESSRQFGEALASLISAPPPAPDAALEAMAAGRRRTAEEFREESRRGGVRQEALRGEVTWYAEAYEQAKVTAAEHHAIAVDRKAEIERLSVVVDEQYNNVRDRDQTIDDINDMLADTHATLEEVRGSRAYRWGLVLRRPVEILRSLRR